MGGIITARGFLAQAPYAIARGKWVTPTPTDSSAHCASRSARHAGQMPRMTKKTRHPPRAPGTRCYNFLKSTAGRAARSRPAASSRKFSGLCGGGIARFSCAVAVVLPCRFLRWLRFQDFSCRRHKGQRHRNDGQRQQVAGHIEQQFALRWPGHVSHGSCPCHCRPAARHALE